MVLTDSQIERYSRQIIVPGVGGRAQERLLASCVALVAEPADAAGALAYLAGAGVGRIMMHPIGDRTSYDALIERMRDLNPEITVGIASEEIPDSYDLILALMGGARAAEAAARIWRAPRADAQAAGEHRSRAAIIAWLEVPGRIALMPGPPPCPLCADADLLSPVGAHAVKSDAFGAGAIAMVAVTEALKLLVGFGGRQPGAELVEFDGYVSRPRRLDRRRVNGGSPVRCACEALA